MLEPSLGHEAAHETAVIPLLSPGRRGIGRRGRRRPYTRRVQRCSPGWPSDPPTFAHADVREAGAEGRGAEIHAQPPRAEPRAEPKPSRAQVSGDRNC